MTPSAPTDAVLLERVRFDVVHDGVRAARITTDSTRFSDREVVETEVVARPPRDVVIGARGIAADADGTDEHAVGVIERQTSSKYIHTADSEIDHRVVGRAVVARVPAVGGIGVDRIAMLKTKEAPTRLH